MKPFALCAVILFQLLSLFFPVNATAEQRTVFAAQKNVAFYKENGKIGLQTTDGTVLHAAAFDGAGYFDATGQANIYIGDQIGRIDRCGNIVVEPFPCHSIDAVPTNSASGAAPEYLLLVSWYDNDNRKLMRLMSMEGEWVSETVFDLMMYEFRDGKLFIRAGDRYNQMDTRGQLTSQEWWDYLFVDADSAYALETVGGNSLYFAKNGHMWARVAKNPDGESTYSLIGAEGVTDTPRSWSNIRLLNENFVAYCENDLWGIADFQTNVVMQAEWLSPPSLVNADDGVWYVVDPVTEEWKWVYSDGEMVLSAEPGVRIQDLSQNRYILYDDEKQTLINHSAEVIAEIDRRYRIKWMEDGGCFRYVNSYDDTWGFMAQQGEILSEFPGSYCEYRDGCTKLVNGCMRIVDEARYNDAGDGQCGFVKPNGEVILSSTWNEIWDFGSNMMARVRVDDKYGYIGENGEYIIQPQWDAADDFIDAGQQWVASVYEYSDPDLVWQGYINENNELLGERWYKSKER